MDDEELDHAFREHYADVALFCRRRLDLASADDAVAEVFATLWRRHHELETSTVRPWLFGVARNVVGTTKRAENRRQRGTLRLVDSTAATFEPDPAGRIAERQLIVEAAGRLGDSDRELLELISWEGLTPRELSVVLECTTEAVHVRIHRLRTRLRTHLRTLDAEVEPTHIAHP